MSTNQPLGSEVEARVRSSFARQRVINTLNGKITHISLGFARDV